MSYNIKVTHTSPTFKQFKEWNIQSAYPTFYINIYFYSEEKEILSFCIKIESHYYCSGSRNLEDIKIIFDSYKNNDNMSNEEIYKLLEDENLISIIKESIKDSMIPNDPIRIIEVITPLHI